MSTRHKVRIPDHLADSSKEIAVEVRQDITPEKFTQAYNTCVRMAEGLQVTFSERMLMLSNLIEVNGKPLTPGEWRALLHDDWQLINEYSRMAANWVCVMLESGKFGGGNLPTEPPCAAGPP